MKAATVPEQKMQTVHDNEAFTIALANLARLKGDRNALEAQRSRITEKRNRELADAREARTKKQVDTLISGGVLAEIPGAEVLDKALRQIAREMPVYDEAIRLSEDTLDRARRVAVIEIQAAMRPQFQAAFRSLAETAIAHAHAVVKVFGLLDTLTAAADGEPQTYLTPMPPYAAMGDPRRESSRLMRLLAASVELGAIGEKDIPPAWAAQWANWQDFRSRDINAITDANEPFWSDAPRDVKKSQPIELPKRRDRDAPAGTLRVRFLQGAAGPGGAFGQRDIADLPDSQALEMIEAGAAEVFKGTATAAVRHADLSTPRDAEDSAWTTVAA